jgi:Rrf2 family protein
LAVRALVVLAEADRATATGAGRAKLKGVELAERLETTPAFLGQVVTPLVRAGWVRSDPGPSGGYGLGAPVSGVSVLDVIEKVDGPTDDGRCVAQDTACNPVAPCLMHLAWQSARGELRRVLAGVSVVSLMQSNEFAGVRAPGEG